MKVRYNGNTACGSQRDKGKIVALWARKMAYKQKKSRARNSPYSALKVFYMGVLSDDFATVDVRKELC